jgi:ankyrin repeat protein
MEDALLRMPKNLLEAFHETLARINRLPEGRKRLGMTTLLWALHAQTSLKADELLDALSVRPGQTTMNPKYRPPLKVVLECCHGLVTVEPKTNIIRLAHFSIQEYLVEHSESLFPRAHASIAETCLTYLMFTEFSNGPGQEFILVRGRLMAYPFLFFASTSGFEHTRMANSDAAVDELLWKFFASPGPMACSHQARRFGQGFRREYWEADESRSVTPLHFAATYGLTAIAEKILDTTGTSVDIATKIGTTPLISAASKEHIQFMHLLLERGASPYLSNWYGNSLHCAAEAGRCEAIKILINFGVDPNVRGVCFCDDDDMTEGSCGRTPLTCTLDRDHAAAAETLLAYGADINAPNCDNVPFLQLAIEYDCIKIVSMLLANAYVNVNSFLVNSRTGVHTTPLHVAARRGREAMIKCLLDAGASPNIADSIGHTPRLPTGSAGKLSYMLDR